MSENNKYYILIVDKSTDPKSSYLVPLKEYLYKLLNFTDNRALETKNQTLIEVGKSAISGFLMAANKYLCAMWGTILFGVIIII